MRIAEVEVHIKRIGQRTFQKELDDVLELRLREIALTGVKATLEQALREELNALFLDDFRLGQVFDARKGGIREILAGIDFG